MFFEDVRDVGECRVECNHKWYSCVVICVVNTLYGCESRCLFCLVDGCLYLIQGITTAGEVCGELIKSFVEGFF